MCDLRWPDKDPQAFKKYALDWTAVLDTGDALSTSAWTVAPAGPTISLTSIVGKVTILWIAGGTNNIDYVFTNHIETTAGMIDDRSVILSVREQ
jgi:hypothetical protein